MAISLQLQVKNALKITEIDANNVSHRIKEAHIEKIDEETYAPTGYAKATTVKVSINSTKTYQVKLVNVKDRQPIYISKQDATTGTELPGAKLVLKDSLGGVVEEWTSGTTPHLVSKKLDPGKYDFCSGHMKDGEIPLQSMYRELKEEMGLSLDKDKLRYENTLEIFYTFEKRFPVFIQ